LRQSSRPPDDLSPIRVERCFAPVPRSQIFARSHAVTPDLLLIPWPHASFISVGCSGVIPDQWRRAASCPHGGLAAYLLLSMVRRSVPLVVTGLALTLSASPYAEVVTPVLKVGQTRMFTPGQLAPGRTVVCAAGSNRLRDKVPFFVHVHGGASVGRASSGNDLTLFILVRT